MGKRIVRPLAFGLIISSAAILFGYAVFIGVAPEGRKANIPLGSIKQGYSTGRPEGFAAGKVNSSGSAVDFQSMSRNAKVADVGAPEVLQKLNIPSADGRVVKNANLELQVKKGEFDSSFERALSIIRSAGGYASQSKSQAIGDRITSGEIIMRIPAEEFDSVLASLKKIGKVKTINITGEDVSEEYVDLESRLRNWRAQESVLLGLMGKAKSVSESIMIQNSLSRVQLEIERINGRLNFLKNRVSFATIRLYIAEPQAIVKPDKWGFKTALENALRASTMVLGAFIILTGYLLPLAALAAIGYAIYRLINLRRVAHSS
ncbi:MAG: DUF4349 domain-containing protein [Firmicutes bacterium]|nr:DUF4349 domain-containing protein [Bacillota bacterium]